ncbi:Alpha/beta hydrolase fold-1 [Bisporella sp. PMI_857]|nr:Alpha/beta hydrolase fold-1 [Bisporella sp. PMI_857]
MTKPSILFVPGSFSLPTFYDDLAGSIRSSGYEITIPHLPSVGLAADQGAPRQPATMYEDAALIAEKVEELADQGKDVILAAHSYGGVPMTESTKGLSKEERSKAGKKGGIVRLAYMTALVPAVGDAAAAVLAVVPVDNMIDFKIDEQGWMYYDDFSKAAQIVFSDMPASEGLALIKRFPRHSAVSFAGELTHAGYKDIPVSYLLCEEDLCVVPEVQRDGIAKIEAASGKKVDITGIKAGHAPSHSATEKVVGWFLNVAKKVEAESTA